MRTQSLSLVLVLAAVLALAGTLSVRIAGAGQAPAPTDTLSALLAEVHALRLAMEQSAGITPRLQVTLARLNIEEQRITQLAAQLDQARRQQTDAAIESQKLTNDLADAEKVLTTDIDEGQRKAATFERTELTRKLAAQSIIEQQLRARESDAAQMLAAEQGRWIELNARLDELERLLAPVRQP
jgi:hypothetical protein